MYINTIIVVTRRQPSQQHNSWCDGIPHSGPCPGVPRQPRLREDPAAPYDKDGYLTTVNSQDSSTFISSQEP